MRNYLHYGLDGQEKVNYTYKINVKSPNPSTNSKPQNCLFWNKNSMCHLNVCFLRNPKTIAPFQIINFLMLQRSPGILFGVQQCFEVSHVNISQQPTRPWNHLRHMHGTGR